MDARMRGDKKPSGVCGVPGGPPGWRLGVFPPPRAPQTSEVSLAWASPSFTPFEDGSRGAGGGGGWPR